MADDLETGTPFARVIKQYMYRVRYPPINPNKLATELGLSRQTVLNWLDGTRPRFDMLPMLSEKFGMPIRDLIDVIGYPSYSYQTGSDSVWQFIENALRDRASINERERGDFTELVRELREEYDASTTSGSVANHETPK